MQLRKPTAVLQLLIAIGALCTGCGAPKGSQGRFENLATDQSDQDLLVLEGSWETVFRKVRQYGGPAVDSSRLPRERTTWLKISGTIVNNSTRAFSTRLLKTQVEGRGFESPMTIEFQLEVTLRPGERKEFQVGERFLASGYATVTSCAAALLVEPASSSAVGGSYGVTDAATTVRGHGRDTGFLSCGLLCLLFASQTVSFTSEDIAQLRQEYGRGILSMADLVSAAGQLGIPAKPFAISGEKGRLSDSIRTPWIAHLKHQHYVVVCETAKEAFKIYDPRKGLLHIERDRFQNIWTGYGLRVNPAAPKRVAGQSGTFPGILFERNSLDLGTVRSGQSFEIVLVVHNVGSFSRRFRLVLSCECEVKGTTTEWELPSAGRVQIPVTYRAPNVPGQFVDTITAVDSAGLIFDRVSIRGSVMPAVYPVPSRLVIKATATTRPATREVEILVPPGVHLPALRATSPSDWLRAAISSAVPNDLRLRGAGRAPPQNQNQDVLVPYCTVLITFPKLLAPGEHTSFVNVEEASGGQLICTIPVKVVVEHRYTVYPSVLNFGYLRGDKATSIELLIQSDHPPIVESVSAPDDLLWSHSISDQGEILSVTLTTAGKRPGHYKGRLLLDIVTSKDVLVIPVYAVIDR